MPSRIEETRCRLAERQHFLIPVDDLNRVTCAWSMQNRSRVRSREFIGILLCASHFEDVRLCGIWASNLGPETCMVIQRIIS